MKTILFVCTGNTCRSSMAEVLFEQMIEKEEKPFRDIRVVSAGTAACTGDRASRYAIEIMEEMGLDLSAHQATPLTYELITQADLILTMTSNHKNMVRFMAPAAFDKIYTLKEYVGEGTSWDIMDPFGQSIQVYRECAREIKATLEKLLNKLKEEFGENSFL